VVLWLSFVLSGEEVVVVADDEAIVGTNALVEGV
jgi:hypothetical protein